MAGKRFLNILITALIAVAGIISCKTEGNSINYEFGTFPDSIINIEGINSPYDDYNSTIPQILGTLPIMFSTNRYSEGNDFDITTGVIMFSFDQVSGFFNLESEMYTNSFYNSLEEAVNTSSDQLGPYRFFNSKNGMEFFFCATGSESGDLDISFMEYIPPSSGEIPYMVTPENATRINTSSDDAYLAIDWDINNLYLTSDRGGDFDIYYTEIDQPSALANWLTGPPAEMTKVDSVNSSSADKCPYIFDDIMIFSSDRPGGFGGYDLYFSTFANGKWGSPVNFGPRINTSSNEYRPIVGFANSYTNFFMIFSSDRPGGKGGYDLYLTGITFEMEDIPASK